MLQSSKFATTPSGLPTLFNSNDFTFIKPLNAGKYE